MKWPPPRKRVCSRNGWKLTKNPSSHRRLAWRFRGCDMHNMILHKPYTSRYRYRGNVVYAIFFTGDDETAKCARCIVIKYFFFFFVKPRALALQHILQHRCSCIIIICKNDKLIGAYPGRVQLHNIIPRIYNTLWLGRVFRMISSEGRYNTTKMFFVFFYYNPFRGGTSLPR